MLVNTPIFCSTKYMTATATNRMTQPTSEIMKLNFMTDQGSILAIASWALRLDGDPWAGKPAGVCRWPAGPGFGRGVLSLPGRCGRVRCLVGLGNVAVACEPRPGSGVTNWAGIGGTPGAPAAATEGVEPPLPYEPFPDAPLPGTRDSQPAVSPGPAGTGGIGSADGTGPGSG